MSYSNVFFAGVCLLCALMIGAIALWAFKSRTPMHFWSGSKVCPEEISDIPAYNRANGLMWAVYAACMAVAGLVGLFNVIAGTVLVIIMCLPGFLALLVVYKKIYNKYRNTSFISRKARLRPRAAKTVIIGTVVITALIFIAVGVLFYHGEKDPDVTLLDDSVQIIAMYGLSIDFADITDVSLIKESMRDIGVGVRTNGYGGFGQSLKGHFLSDNTGETLLFVQSKSSPTIRIGRAGKNDVYISFKDSEETERLYSEIKDAIKGKGFDLF